MRPASWSMVLTSVAKASTRVNGECDKASNFRGNPKIKVFFFAGEPI